MNDGFASFVTQQAFGLGIGQHASIHHFSKQIDTAMLNNEEGEGLLGGSFRIVIDGDQFSAIVELPKN